jgi:hypothetical protein
VKKEESKTKRKREQEEIGGERNEDRNREK